MADGLKPEVLKKLEKDEHLVYLPHQTGTKFCRRPFVFKIKLSRELPCVLSDATGSKKSKMVASEK